MGREKNIYRIQTSKTVDEVLTTMKSHFKYGSNYWKEGMFGSIDGSSFKCSYYYNATKENLSKRRNQCKVVGSVFNEDHVTYIEYEIKGPFKSIGFRLFTSFCIISGGLLLQFRFGFNFFKLALLISLAVFLILTFIRDYVPEDMVKPYEDFFKTCVIRDRKYQLKKE